MQSASMTFYLVFAYYPDAGHGLSRGFCLAKLEYGCNMQIATVTSYGRILNSIEYHSRLSTLATCL